ncbi:hypothetical protein [Stackebrandtia nassauensis]|uniref:Uncharacterized protein n=1 Tax=Stackebrandtia nassauensis (strain DSM 44728 / CIP 108903 / NRRL B-16338 / NBRC 102104 / LLR-40K-21) TaxID=446470 RepID=D3Q0C8_STANL|nr:hypothetical protein [Stackebrandtia nassauensis]ADD39792.1 hypothetical protein Snas_0070 [Stackebrandtia nassauensis DSM 44728]
MTNMTGAIHEAVDAIGTAIIYAESRKGSWVFEQQEWLDFVRELSPLMHHQYGRLANCDPSPAKAASKRIESGKTSLAKNANPNGSLESQTKRIKKLCETWRSDGGYAFHSHIGKMEFALLHQQEMAAVLSSLMELHSSHVLATQEDLLNIANLTIDSLERHGYDIQQKERQKLGAILDTLVSVASGGIVGSLGSGAAKAVGEAVSGIKGSSAVSAAMQLPTDDTMLIIKTMKRKVDQLIEQTTAQQSQIRVALTSVFEAYVDKPIMLPPEVATGTLSDQDWRYATRR